MKQQKQVKLYYLVTPNAHKDLFSKDWNKENHLWTRSPLSDVINGPQITFYDNATQRDNDFFAWTQRHKSNKAYIGELVIYSGKAVQLKTMMDISEDLP